MKTVLFLSLFGIGNVFGEEVCEVSKGSPRLVAKLHGKVESAEMCANACIFANKCLFWKYNDKSKKCMFTLLKVKSNKKTRFGVNCLLGGKVFEGALRLKARNVKKIKSADLCYDACQSKDNCVLWMYNNKNKKCKINVFNVKPNPKASFGFSSSAPPPTTLPPKICPEGSNVSEHTGACYRIFTDAKSWFDAQENCTSYGGDLVSIHDEIELDFVKDMLYAEDQGYVWLGGYFINQTVPGIWEWSDGSSFDFTYFQDVTDPTYNGRCMESVEDESWKWRGYVCSYEQAWMCKI